MTAPFAALEARVNSAVFKRLANADAYLDWEPVSGIFDNASALGSVGPYGMASFAPIFTLASASVPPNAIGLKLVIGEDTETTDAVTYTIVGTEPDGTGITRLILELAA